MLHVNSEMLAHLTPFGVQNSVRFVLLFLGTKRTPFRAERETVTTTPVNRPTTCSGWIVALSECLTLQFRTDGTHYMALSPEAKWDEIRDDLQNIVLEAHCGELPNDWRYDTIDSIASTLAAEADASADVEKFRDLSHEVADSLVDTYTKDLLQWVAGNIRRHQWDDSDFANQAEPGDIAALIRLRQFEEIKSMVHIVLNEIQHLLDEA